jgi:hypothetical protein
MSHLVKVDGRIIETEVSGTGDKTLVILPGMATPNSIAIQKITEYLESK